MGTEVLDYKAAQAKELEELKKRIQQPGGDLIRTTQSKEFILPDGVKGPGPLSMVIIDFVYSNQWFDRPFNKDDMTVPACFAFGDLPTGLIPEKTSPLLQTEEEEGCDVCPFNQYKSHANGKGKACNNIVIAAVAHPDLKKDPKIYRIKFSATAIKPFSSYIMGIKTQFEAMSYGVISQIYFAKESDYPSLRCGDPVPNPTAADHWALKKAARERLMALPDVSQFKAYEAPKKAGRPAVKK